MSQTNHYSCPPAAEADEFMRFINGDIPSRDALEKRLFPISSSFENLRRVLADFVIATGLRHARRAHELLTMCELANNDLTDEERKENEERAFSNNENNYAHDFLEASRDTVGLSNEIVELRNLTEELSERYEKLACALHFVSESGTIIANVPNTQFYITVTSAMLQNSMITVTKAIHEKVINIGDEIEIKLPWGERFKTQVLSPGNRLKERAKIRLLFEKEKVEAMDKVLFRFEENLWNIEVIKSFASNTK